MPPRWLVSLELAVLHYLMAIGMFLHRIPSPRPLWPSFCKTIPTSDALRTKGKIRLHFYTPRPYFRRTSNQKFPVVVNFHGGGFSMGRGTDDCRWASTLVKQIDVLCVSVDYRLAPEYHFPFAIEDGADAIQYLVRNANRLGIDPMRIAVSGFSAGGNLAFSVPLLLQQRTLQSPPLNFRSGLTEDSAQMLVGRGPGSDGQSTQKLLKESRRITSDDYRILAIAAWYPRVDFRTSREELRKVNARPDKHLPVWMCNLFDQAYLYPPHLDKSNPLLSPAAASDEALKSLPDTCILFSCEWDMLCKENVDFANQLSKLGKNVKHRTIERVRHGWDKAPNPLKRNFEAAETYEETCAELRQIFDIA